MKTTIKSNRAKIAALIFTGLAFLASLALFSCSNFSDGSDSSASASSDGKTYVSFSAQSVDGSAKTIQPGASAAYLSALTDISVTGSLSGGAEQSLISAATYSAFTSASSIQIEPGDWTFTFTAKLDGVDFGATTTKTIQFGTTNAIEFALKANVTYGGLKVDVTFAGAAPSKVVATLCKQNKTTQIDQATITDFGAGGAPTFTYERVLGESTGLAAGTYWLNFDFYKDGVSDPVNSFGNYVRIVNGITSKADFTLDLNEVYALSYAYYLNGVKVTDPDTIAQLQASLAVGANLPSAYSRKSEIDLPSFSYSGYDFMGWYRSNSDVVANQISKIQKGTTGPKTLCAFFEMTSVSGSIPNDLPDNLVFVANSVSGGASTNDGTESKPLDSIEHAVEKIHQIVQSADPAPKANASWGIVLLSDLTGAQKVPATVSGQDVKNDYLYLYIASKSSDDIKTMDGGFSGTDPTGSDSGTTLTIEPYNYTYLQCVNVTGGWAVLGGGVKFYGRKLYIKAGAQIYGNKAIDRGAGILAYPSTSGQGQVVLQGGTIGGDGNHSNVCTGNGSTYGYGGGVAIMGGGTAGFPSSSLMEFIMESGSVKGNKAYKGAGVYLTGRCGVSIQGGSVTNNTTEDYTGGEGGAICIENITGSGSVTVSGGSISSNTAAKGGAIYANQTPFTLSGGTISGNTATSGDGAGLYFYTDNVAKNFYMQGNGSFGENDYVCFPDTSISPIKLIGMLTGPAHVATLQLAHYTHDAVLIQDMIKPAPGLDAFSSICSRFTVLPDSNNKEYYIRAVASADPDEGCSGLLTKVVDPADITYYVSPSGNDSNSGRDATSNALLTINGAIQKIKTQQTTDPNTEYIIKVNGTLTDKQVVGGQTTATFASQINKITIEGYNGLSSGEPQDGINVTGATGPSTPVLIASFDNTLKQLLIKNLKITGGNGGGLNVGGYSDDLTCHIVLGEGTRITGNNSSNDGAGVALRKGCKLTVLDGAKITGNSTSGNGGGVMLNANTTLYMYGGEISGNVAGNDGSGYGSGVYVGGSSSDGDAVIALQGNALIASDNDVYLKSVSAIASQCHSLIYVESYLDQDHVATITPAAYQENSQLIFTRAPSDLGPYVIYPNVSEVYDKFAVTAQSGGSTWALNENGELYKTGNGSGGGGGTSGSVAVYVAQGGTGDGSSASSPLGSINAAALAIKSMVAAQSADEAIETDYVIKVNGMLSGPQCLFASYDYLSQKAKSFTIEGANELVGGVPQDGIDAGLDENSSLPTGSYGAALSINTGNANTIVLKNLKLTGGYNKEWATGGGGLALGGGTGIGSNSSTTVCLGAGVLITGNSAANGAGVYVTQRSTLIMEGGTISGNVLVQDKEGNDGIGSGIYLDEEAKLELSGSAQVASDNDICLVDTTSSIVIAGPLSQSDVATIIPSGNHHVGDQIIELKFDESIGDFIDTTSLAAEHDKFYVPSRTGIVGGMIQITDYFVDEYGKLEVVNNSGGGGTSSEPLTIYVASASASHPGSSTGDGTDTSPFASISDAIAECLSDISHTKYIIKIDGFLTEAQYLTASPMMMSQIESITIEGKNGPDSNGIPQDGIVVPEGEYYTTAFTINFAKSTLNLVTLKNLKITSEKGQGISIGNSWDTELNKQISCNVILDEGVLITGCHYDNKGAGISVGAPGSVVTMKSGAKISGNSTTIFAGGVYIQGQSSFIMRGGEISGNTAASNGGGVYVYSGAYFEMSGDAVVDYRNNNYVYLASIATTPLRIGGPLNPPQIDPQDPDSAISAMIELPESGLVSGTPVIALGFDSEGNEITTTTVGAAYTKFGLEPVTKTV